MNPLLASLLLPAVLLVFGLAQVDWQAGALPIWFWLTVPLVLGADYLGRRLAFRALSQPAGLARNGVAALGWVLPLIPFMWALRALREISA